MNTQNYFILLLLLSMAPSLRGAALVEEASKKLLPGEKKLFTTIIEERQERVAARKKERAAMQTADREFTTNVSNTIDRLKNEITGLEQATRATPENEFVKQKLEVSLERFQLLADLKASRSQVIASWMRLKNLTKSYLEDPDTKKYTATLLGKDKSSYSFDEDLLPLHEKILERERDIAQLNEQEANAATELENRKRAAVGHSRYLMHAKKDKKIRAGPASERQTARRNWKHCMNLPIPIAKR